MGPGGMCDGGQNSRSSKTAHVLNLLSGGTPEVKPDAVPPPREAPPPPPLEPAPLLQTCPCRRLRPSAARRLSPPILEVARSNNAALSESIHTALESALQEELASSEQTAAPLRSLLHLPLPQRREKLLPRFWTLRPPLLLLPLLLLPLPSPSVPEQASTELSDGAELFNVMQLLVAEKLERYVKLFGLCSCPRCLADAEALALTRLPAQYAVFPPDLLPTKLSVYRARYDSEITRQIIWACKSVMDSPGISCPPALADRKFLFPQRSSLFPAYRSILPLVYRGYGS